MFAGKGSGRQWRAEKGGLRGTACENPLKRVHTRGTGTSCAGGRWDDYTVPMRHKRLQHAYAGLLHPLAGNQLLTGVTYDPPHLSYMLLVNPSPRFHRRGESQEGTMLTSLPSLLLGTEESLVQLVGSSVSSSFMLPLCFLDLFNHSHVCLVYPVLSSLKVMFSKLTQTSGHSPAFIRNTLDIVLLLMASCVSLAPLLRQEEN